MTAIVTSTTPTGEAIAFISQSVDDSYGVIDPEAHEWRRSMKMVQEVGEVFEAIAGVMGENPRKGVTHGPSDVDEEVLDVALAALAYWEHRHGNRGVCLEALREHAQARAIRLREQMQARAEAP